MDEHPVEEDPAAEANPLSGRQQAELLQDLARAAAHPVALTVCQWPAD